MCPEITAQDIIRIGGFLGYEKGEFAEKLGISTSYLSRLLKGKNPLSKSIVERALTLFEEHVLKCPNDHLVQKIIASASKNVKNSFPENAARLSNQDILKRLYSKPLPSSRAGVFYNTFPYPTKISPESIAVYIACTTQPGDTVLDAFAGSGSTGIAALLCEHPTERMIKLAEDLNVEPVWGPRNAVLYEIGTYASFAIRTILSRVKSSEFSAVAENFLKKGEQIVGSLYESKDPSGNTGTIRYVIWTELLICPDCGSEVSYFKIGTSRDPVEFKTDIQCPFCKKWHHVDDMDFVKEDYVDPLLGKKSMRKKRIPAWIYGTTQSHNWDRPATEEDIKQFSLIEKEFNLQDQPLEIEWGELHRAGYHFGITHLHHFYSARNYIVMSRLWRLAETYSKKYADILKLLLLSYNSAHGTLMTRVVAKKKAKDFILTSSQSGVLYISRMPVEKNILLGLKRKSKLFTESFKLLENCSGKITLHNCSSTKMLEQNNSIDFVFTDPPFGDFIPYAEVNQINELWLNSVTDRKEEIIISQSQNKDVKIYQRLLADVFYEINRVLKPDHYASIVFHAAKAKVWEAFVGAITASGLSIELTNILDKKQSSFKQVVSADSVQGDPLFLVRKGVKLNKTTSLSNTEILKKLISEHIKDPDFDSRTCYSRYVNRCLELGLNVYFDAKQVYDYYDSYKVAHDEQQ